MLHLNQLESSRKIIRAEIEQAETPRNANDATNETRSARQDTSNSKKCSVTTGYQRKIPLYQEIQDRELRRW